MSDSFTLKWAAPLVFLIAGLVFLVLYLGVVKQPSQEQPKTAIEIVEPNDSVKLEPKGVVSEFAVSSEIKIELRTFLDGVYTFRYHGRRGVESQFFHWWPETLKVFMEKHPDLAIAQSATGGIYDSHEETVEYWEQVSVSTIRKAD